jgi:hypothetical protein
LRFLLSNAAVGALAAVALVVNVDALGDDFRISLLLLIIYEALLIVIVLFRRDVASIDRRLVPYAVALIAITTPFWLRPEKVGEDLLAGEVVQIAALLLHLTALGSLGRSFGVVPANRGVKTGGAYRWVRHPMYAADILGQAGFLISHRTLLNATAVVVAVVTQSARIHFEEQHLARDPEYADYMTRHRWRLVPGVW